MERSNTDNNYVIACLLVLLRFAILLFMSRFMRSSAVGHGSNLPVELALLQLSGIYSHSLPHRRFAHARRPAPDPAAMTSFVGW